MGTIYKPTRNDTSKLWKNGKDKDSNYGRSRLKIVYSIDGSTASIDYYLQMARSNGDYNTHGTVTAYINGKSTGAKNVTISDGCAKRSDKDANNTVPDSYFTTVGSLKNQSISCDKAGNFSESFTVKASCGVNNMVLAERTGSFSFGGGTIYSESPTMKITEDDANYTHVYAACDVTNWGEYGTTEFTSKDYDKYAYLYYKDEYTGRSTKFSDATQVSFYVGASSESRDYEIKFRIENSTFKLEKWAYANPTKFINPSGPDNVKIEYSNEDNSEEPTLVSTYTLSWTENDWGSAPSGSTKAYRVRIYICNSNGTPIESIGYLKGDSTNAITRQSLDSGNSYWINRAYDKNTMTINKSTWSSILSKLKVGDYICIGVFSRVDYDEKTFWSGKGTSEVRSNIVGPIQDDQAKVYIPEANKVGKVWVLDESTNTWKKAKKIFVNTSTNSNSSTWTKHKNPTI